MAVRLGSGDEGAKATQSGASSTSGAASVGQGQGQAQTQSHEDSNGNQSLPNQSLPGDGVEGQRLSEEVVRAERGSRNGDGLRGTEDAPRPRRGRRQAAQGDRRGRRSGGGRGRTVDDRRPNGQFRQSIGRGNDTPANSGAATQVQTQAPDVPKGMPYWWNDVTDEVQQVYRCLERKANGSLENGLNPESVGDASRLLGIVENHLAVRKGLIALLLPADRASELIGADAEDVLDGLPDIMGDSFERTNHKRKVQRAVAFLMKGHVNDTVLQWYHDTTGEHLAIAVRDLMDDDDDLVVRESTLESLRNESGMVGPAFYMWRMATKTIGTGDDTFMRQLRSFGPDGPDADPGRWSRVAEQNYHLFLHYPPPPENSVAGAMRWIGLDVFWSDGHVRNYPSDEAFVAAQRPRDIGDLRAFVIPGSDKTLQESIEALRKSGDLPEDGDHNTVVYRKYVTSELSGADEQLGRILPDAPGRMRDAFERYGRHFNAKDMERYKDVVLTGSDYQMVLHAAHTPGVGLAKLVSNARSTEQLAKYEIAARVLLAEGWLPDDITEDEDIMQRSRGGYDPSSSVLSERGLLWAISKHGTSMITGDSPVPFQNGWRAVVTRAEATPTPTPADAVTTPSDAGKAQRRLGRKQRKAKQEATRTAISEINAAIGWTTTDIDRVYDTLIKNVGGSIQLLPNQQGGAQEDLTDRTRPSILELARAFHKVHPARVPANDEIGGDENTRVANAFATYIMDLFEDESDERRAVVCAILTGLHPDSEPVVGLRMAAAKELQEASDALAAASVRVTPDHRNASSGGTPDRTFDMVLASLEMIAASRDTGSLQTALVGSMRDAQQFAFDHAPHPERLVELLTDLYHKAPKNSGSSRFGLPAIIEARLGLAEVGRETGRLPTAYGDSSKVQLPLTGGEATDYLVAAGEAAEDNLDRPWYQRIPRGVLFEHEVVEEEWHQFEVLRAQFRSELDGIVQASKEGRYYKLVGPQGQVSYTEGAPGLEGTTRQMPAAFGNQPYTAVLKPIQFTHETVPTGALSADLNQKLMDLAAAQGATQAELQALADGAYEAGVTLFSMAVTWGIMGAVRGALAARGIEMSVRTALLAELASLLTTGAVGGVVVGGMLNHDSKWYEDAAVGALFGGSMFFASEVFVDAMIARRIAQARHKILQELGPAEGKRVLESFENAPLMQKFLTKPRVREMLRIAGWSASFGFAHTGYYWYRTDFNDGIVDATWMIFIEAAKGMLGGAVMGAATEAGKPLLRALWGRVKAQWLMRRELAKAQAKNFDEHVRIALTRIPEEDLLVAGVPTAAPETVLKAPVPGTSGADVMRNLIVVKQGVDELGFYMGDPGRLIPASWFRGAGQCLPLPRAPRGGGSAADNALYDEAVNLYQKAQRHGLSVEETRKLFAYLEAQLTFEARRLGPTASAVAGAADSTAGDAAGAAPAQRRSGHSRLDEVQEAINTPKRGNPTIATGLREQTEGRVRAFRDAQHTRSAPGSDASQYAEHCKLYDDLLALESEGILKEVADGQRALADLAHGLDNARAALENRVSAAVRAVKEQAGNLRARPNTDDAAAGFAATLDAARILGEIGPLAKEADAALKAHVDELGKVTEEWLELRLRTARTQSGTDAGYRAYRDVIELRAYIGPRVAVLPPGPRRILQNVDDLVGTTVARRYGARAAKGRVKLKQYAERVRTERASLDGQLARVKAALEAGNTDDALMILSDFLEQFGRLSELPASGWRALGIDRGASAAMRDAQKELALLRAQFGPRLQELSHRLQKNLRGDVYISEKKARTLLSKVRGLGKDTTDDLVAHLTGNGTPMSRNEALGALADIERGLQPLPADVRQKLLETMTSPGELPLSDDQVRALAKGLDGIPWGETERLRAALRSRMDGLNLRFQNPLDDGAKELRKKAAKEAGESEPMTIERFMKQTQERLERGEGLSEELSVAMFGHWLPIHNSAQNRQMAVAFGRKAKPWIYGTFILTGVSVVASVASPFLFGRNFFGMFNPFSDTHPIFGESQKKQPRIPFRRDNKFWGNVFGGAVSETLDQRADEVESATQGAVQQLRKPWQPTQPTRPGERRPAQPQAPAQGQPAQQPSNPVQGPAAPVSPTGGGSSTQMGNVGIPGAN